MEDNKPANKSLEIKIDAETAQGRYSNLAAISHQETNFIIDFIFVEPQAPAGKVFSRVITSPQHAKRLLKALEENIAKYEAHYGVIQLNPASEPTHSGSPGMSYYH